MRSHEGFQMDGRGSGRMRPSRQPRTGPREVCDLVVAADVTRPEEMARWARATIEHFGHIDVVVANPGISRRGSVENADLADVEAIYRVNVFGVLHTIRAVMPAMRQQGHGRLIGRIVADGGVLCPAGGVGYTSSKAAVMAIIRSLSHELAGSDILANCMFPGICRTAMNPESGQDPALAYPTARLLATLPAGGPSGRTSPMPGSTRSTRSLRLIRSPRWADPTKALVAPETGGHCRAVFRP